MMLKRILVYDDSFKEELVDIVKYISFDLNNPNAAKRLSAVVQNSILNRLQFPGTFEPFRPTKPLKFTYYRIYIGNYTVYYYFDKNEMHISHIFYYASDFTQKLK